MVAHRGDTEAMRELGSALAALNARRPRRYQRDEFIENHMEEISCFFTAMRQYLEVYSIPLLQNLDFNTFCNFCYLYSERMR